MKNFLFAIAATVSAALTVHAQPSSPPNQKIMKEYVLVVRLKENPYTPEEFKIVNARWTVITDKWKADGIFVTSFVFPGISYVVSETDRKVKKESVFSGDLRVVSALVLRAESLEAAVELAKLAPVVEYGGTVEVREALPRPARP